MKEVINHMAKKLSKIALITGVISGVIAGPLMIANAASNTPYCKFGDKLAREINVSGSYASATFKIPEHCPKNLTYSLVFYKTCNPTLKPFSQQQYHHHKTVKLGPGTHTISGVHVPSNIYWQGDLIKGEVVYNLSDNGTYAPTGRLINATSGGEACPTPQQPAPQQPAPQQPSNPTPPANDNNNSNNGGNTTNNNNSNANASVNNSGNSTVNNKNVVRNKVKVVNNNVNNNTQSQSQTVNVGVTGQPSSSSSSSGSSSSANASASGTAGGASGAAVSAATSGGDVVAEVSGKGGPDVLPNTGVGNLIATFLGVTSISSLGFNLFLRRFKTD